MKSIRGNIVDIHKRRIFKGEVQFADGRITAVVPKSVEEDVYIAPGFVDAHVHIESSMLTPAGFSELVVPRGTVAVVTDPHEIANVLGVSGIEDRKSTRLNSSHVRISYAVFCLKKKK